MDGDTYNHGDPLTIWERLSAIAGGTTYREPAGGVSTAHRAIPRVHELCAALGWAKDPDDPFDCGADVAIDRVTSSGRNERKVADALVGWLASQGHRRIVQRNKAYLRCVAWSAYLSAVLEMQAKKPPGISDADWARLTREADGRLENLAESAVNRAAHFMGWSP